MRKAIIAANWKMHKTKAETLEFIRRFKELVKEVRLVEIVVAPPFTVLELLKRKLEGTGIKLAAQNAHFAQEGAYTGEISPPMLKELGCDYVIIGHSERREHFKEDDELINRKLAAAFACSLIPILCVGEGLEERKAGMTEAMLEREIRTDLKGLLGRDVARTIVAYEPIWAIGTGETASPKDASDGVKFIREVVAELYSEQVAQSLRVQYGGSVNPDNIEELMKEENIDGALVGGASLDPEAFAEIVVRVERLLKG